MISNISKFAAVALLLALAANAGASTMIISLTSNDMTFDPATGLLYAAVGSSASTNPNTIVPINPQTGATGSAIGVLTNPTHVVSSSDGTYLYVVTNSSQTVQRYNPSTGTFNTPVAILGGYPVSQIDAVPGYSDMVAITQNDPQYSPSEIQTAIYQNGVALPNHIGNGLGVGGPDIIAVDETGTHLYGYITTLSSYDNTYATITAGASGGLTTFPAPLEGIMSGPVGRIALAHNRLFNSNGDIFSLTTPSLIGEFPTTGTFDLDPANDRFYTVVNNGSSQSIDVFYMDFTNSMTEYGSIPVTGEVGGIDEIVRFGVNGLALRTPTQVILLNSALVPEPRSILLLAIGGLGLAAALR